MLDVSLTARNPSPFTPSPAKCATPQEVHPGHCLPTLVLSQKFLLDRKLPPSPSSKAGEHRVLDSRPWGNTSPSRSCRREEILGSKSTLRPGCPTSSLFLCGKPKAHGWRLDRQGSGDPAPSPPAGPRPPQSPGSGHGTYNHPATGRLLAALGPNRQGASTAQKLGAASCCCHGDHSAATTAAAETQTLYSRLTEPALPSRAT